MTTTNSFKDGNGKEYVLRISAKIAEDLKDQLGLDVGLLVTDKAGDLIKALSSDLSRVVSAVVLILESQVGYKDRTLDPKSFAAAMFGPEIVEASRALVDAMADFYGPGKAPALKAMIAKAWEAEAAAAEKLEQMINQTDTTEDAVAEMERVFLQAHSNSGRPSTRRRA